MNSPNHQCLQTQAGFSNTLSTVWLEHAMLQLLCWPNRKRLLSSVFSLLITNLYLWTPEAGTLDAPTLTDPHTSMSAYLLLTFRRDQHLQKWTLDQVMHEMLYSNWHRQQRQKWHKDAYQEE